MLIVQVRTDISEFMPMSKRYTDKHMYICHSGVKCINNECIILNSGKIM